MRRAVPSFTVEVRRRPRLATKASQDLHLSDTKIQAATFESESHRLAAVTFGAAKTPDEASADVVASHPKRRILQSLVPERSPAGQLQDALSSAATPEPASRAPKPPSGRARKGKDQATKRSANLEASSELTPQSADGFSVASVRASGASPNDGTANSPGMPTAKSNRVFGDSGGPAPRPKAKRRVRIPIAHDASPAPVSANDQGSIPRTGSLEALPTAADDVSRPNRKRTILGRYVFGDELKPGERWKRRLSKGR